MVLAMNLFPAAPRTVTPLIQSRLSSALTIHQGVSRSLHFIRRTEERGLREDVLEFVLTFGTEWRRMGATHLTVIERDLPPGVRGCVLAAKAKDWIVMVSDDSVPITCYRRANAVHFLRRKDKRCWSEAQIAERRMQKKGDKNG